MPDEIQVEVQGEQVLVAGHVLSFQEAYLLGMRIEDAADRADRTNYMNNTGCGRCVGCKGDGR